MHSDRITNIWPKPSCRLNRPNISRVNKRLQAVFTLSTCMLITEGVRGGVKNIFRDYYKSEIGEAERQSRICSLRLSWDGRFKESTPALFGEIRFVLFFVTSHGPRYVLQLSYSVIIAHGFFQSTRINLVINSLKIKKESWTVEWSIPHFCSFENQGKYLWDESIFGRLNFGGYMCRLRSIH